MKALRTTQPLWRRAVCCLGLAAVGGSIGCQSQVGGQLLPSPYYLSDDVQYFAPGPEFKLAQEAAAMKAANAEQAAAEGTSP